MRKLERISRPTRTASEAESDRKKVITSDDGSHRPEKGIDDDVIGKMTRTELIREALSMELRDITPQMISKLTSEELREILRDNSQKE